MRGGDLVLSGSLVRDTSAAFAITPAPAATLVFTAQPRAVTAGDLILPAPAVTAYDVFGNLASTFTDTVVATLTAGTGTEGAALTGSTRVAALSGVATFGALRVDSVGTGYRLEASSGGLPAAVSDTFSVTEGAANRLAFISQPTAAVAGETIAPAVRVAVHDAFGNTLTSDASQISIAIGTNPAGGTLFGTTPVAAVNGVATFSDLRVDRAGSGYTLRASRTGVPDTVSAAFDIQVGTEADEWDEIAGQVLGAPA